MKNTINNFIHSGLDKTQHNDITEAPPRCTKCNSPSSTASVPTLYYSM